MSVPVRTAVAVLALVAAALAAYLTYGSFTHQVMAGCDGTGQVDCNVVLSSSWSRFIGIPVALGGLLAYVPIFAMSWFAGSRDPLAIRWIGTTITALALLAVGAGAWFTFVQLVFLGKFCWYCLSTHFCGLIIAGLVVWSVIALRKGGLNASQSLAAIPGMPPAIPGTRARSSSNGPSLGIAAGFAVSLLAILIAGQVFFPTQTYGIEKKVALTQTINMTDAGPSAISPVSDPKAHVVNRVTPTEDPHAISLETSASPSDKAVESTNVAADHASVPDVPMPVEGPAKKREVKLLNGTLTIDMYSQAVLGSPEAPYVVVEMVDYMCPHCRAMHKNIKLALDRYGDQLAVVIMPVPLELECNKQMMQTDPTHRGSCKLARLAVSVAKINLTAFHDFHNWMLADEKKPPSVSDAVQRAWELVNRKRLAEFTDSDATKNRIQQDISLYVSLSNQQKDSLKPFGLPVQIVGDTVLSGKVDNVDDMFAAWEQALGIKPTVAE